MADTHESIHEEFEVTLKVRVTLKEAYFYGIRTLDQLRHEIESAKKEMHDELMSKLEGEFITAERLGDNKWGYMNYLYNVKDADPVKSK